MNKVTIKRLGQGMGANEKVEVLSRKEIVKIIEDLGIREIAEMAWSGFNKGFKTGYATIELETGELSSTSLGQGESNQAIDNTYITIYDFDQNFDIGDMELRGEDGEELEEEEEVIEAMFDEIELSCELDWNDINRQLDEFYGKETANYDGIITHLQEIGKVSMMNIDNLEEVRNELKNRGYETELSPDTDYLVWKK